MYEDILYVRLNNTSTYVDRKSLLKAFGSDYTITVLLLYNNKIKRGARYKTEAHVSQHKHICTLVYCIILLFIKSRLGCCFNHFPWKLEHFINVLSHADRKWNKRSWQRWQHRSKVSKVSKENSIVKACFKMDLTCLLIHATPLSPPRSRGFVSRKASLHFALFEQSISRHGNPSIRITLSRKKSHGGIAGERNDCSVALHRSEWWTDEQALPPSLRCQREEGRRHCSLLLQRKLLCHVSMVQSSRWVDLYRNNRLYLGDVWRKRMNECDKHE